MKPTRKGILSWITGTIKDALDAANEERISPYVSRIDAEFARLKEQFNFDKTTEALQIPSGDRPLVAQGVYRRFLHRSWKDFQISPREAKLLGWVADTLGLSPSAVAALNTEAAADAFKASLAKVMADGRVDEAEAAALQTIAAHAGLSVGDLMARFFEKEGDALLRSVFSQAVADGRLSKEEWNEFRNTAERLGIPRDKMLHAIQRTARQLVEHAFADARSDGEISEQEEKTLVALIDHTIDDKEFSAYALQQITEAREARRLTQGLLPSIAHPPGVALRAGEIVHWVGPVVYVRVRELDSGTKTTEIHGDAVITDARMILNASERSLEVNHRKVLAHVAFGDAIEIRAATKGAGRYSFPDKGERAVRIWQVAVGRANQTIVASDDSQSRRRISREVRQRVWQRYCGRCAECNSDSYLEFDHIVPVAKGGGNSETNVQLLCRRCNLAKSDNI
jgi:tellurite resistance protein